MAENAGTLCTNGLLLSLGQKLSGRVCLCSIKLDGNFLKQANSLINLIKLTNQDKNLQQKLTEERDEILVQLSLLTELFGARHCSAVHIITKTILEDTRFLSALDALLETDDSLVAYCACKCLAAAIINCLVYLPDDYLKTLISSIQVITSDSNSLTTPGNANKVIYTLGALKQVVRCSRNTETLESDHKKCPCMDGAKSQGTEHMLLTQHCQTIKAELPFMVSTFLQLAKSVQQNTNGKPKQLSLKQTDYSLILMEFLEFTHEVIKCSITLDTQKSNCEVNHAVLHVFERIVEFLWLDNLKAVNMKKILDISNCILDYIVSKIVNQDCNKKVTAVCMLVIKQTVDGWLDRIEYRNVALGFGGPLIAGGSTDDYCIGDYPLLRQLVRMWMSVAVIVLNDKQQLESVLPVQSSMAVLSRYITNKLSMDKDAAFNKWIFVLFCDQDDSLILIMLRALQFYKLLQTKLHVCNSQEIKLQSTHSFDILDPLNPYVNFVNFLESVTFDPNLLLDLLMSNETCFLEYLVQYIRLTLTNWDKFSTCMKRVKLASQDDSEGEEENRETMAEVVIDRDIQTSDESEIEEEDSIKMEEAQDEKDREIKRSDGFDVQRIESKQDPTEIMHQVKDDNLVTHTLNLYSEEQSTEKQWTETCKRTSGSSVEINVLESKEAFNPDDKRNSIQEKGLETFVNFDNYSNYDDSGDDNDDDDGIGPKSKKMKLTPSKCDLSNSSNARLTEESSDSSIIAKNVTLDEVMTVMIRLRISIEKMSMKGLFPYNIAPLLRLLEQMEAKYEQ